MCLFVPEDVLDYDEIFRRGGRNLGDEDFALFKCPNCNQVYLMDYEVDTVYLNAVDLSQRAGVAFGSFNCVRCGLLVPEGAWVGPKQDKAFAVTWDEALASEWNWTIRKDARK